MNKKFYFAIFIGLMTTMLVSAQSQKDYSNDRRVLMTIGTHPITVAEYMSVYSKNNSGNNVLDKKSPEEYLSLYTDFKLKVLEAETQQLDTVPTFINELEGYRKQLSAPYLEDKNAENQLIEEAYRFMQEDLRASHILVLCDEFADPKDTLAAFQKIEKLRKRVLKGEDFNAVAEEASEDPSARDREPQGQRPFLSGNRGDLGYFTAFNMIYPFEKEVYTLQEGQISKPFRTPIGYHIVKVTKRMPAKGKITASHIFFEVKKEYSQHQKDSILARANEAYQKLQNGEKWSAVIKMSDDKNSAQNDGTLPPFAVNRMVPEFIEGVCSLQNYGDYTKPIKTSYGYHIIRLDKLEPILSFEETKPLIQKKIANDFRSKVLDDAVISNIKNEYGFEEYAGNLQKFLTVCDTVSINDAKWRASAATSLNFDMFKIGDSVLSVQNFATFVETKQTPHLGGTQKDMIKKINNYYKEWVDKTCIAYKEEQLPKTNMDYALLLQEYREGMLLFEVMDKEIWKKSMTDTAGLNAYFATQRNQYMYKERCSYSEMTFVGFENEKAAQKAIAQISKKFKKGASNETIEAEYEQQGIKVALLNKKVEKGASAKIDSLWNQPAGYFEFEKADNNKVKVLRINSIIPPEPKELKYVRGAVTATYQAVLEENWMQSLKKKYPVIINNEIFNELK